ncbi:MAG: ABC transporter ATP-binding protein/permease [Treponema sp.]|nr:ABC transporter ATP-binding protein/permease [Treponema sp.]
MKHIIQFLGKKRFFVMVLLSLWASATTFGSFFYPLLIRNIIEGVEQHHTLDMGLVLLYAGIMLAAALLTYSGTFVYTRYLINFSYKLRGLLVGDFLSVNDREKKDNGIGVYQNRAHHEVTSTVMLFRTDTIRGFILLGRIGFALYIGFLWDIFIGLIFLASILLYMLSAFLQSRLSNPVYKKMLEDYESYSVFTIGILNGINTILNRKVHARYLKRNAEFTQQKIRLETKMMSIQNTITILFFGLLDLAGSAGLLAYSLHLFLQGELSLGQAFAVLTYLDYIMNPIMILSMIQQRYLEGIPYIKKLLPIIENAQKNEREGRNTPQETLSPTEVMLSAKNLFYTTGNTTLIDNISFSILLGEKVAIVGQSGEGKSAFLDILLKNFPEYEGEATFMGRDLKTLDRQTILSNIGYYAQDIYVFNENVHDNIANLNTAEGEVDALLPEFGLEGLKGRLLGENGVNISKGEKSRVEFMRLLLNDRPFAILDEPFDGLDAFTKEKMVTKAAMFLKNKTAIVISHDFSILRQLATKYIFIGSDKKLSIGSHEELYGSNADYKKLYDKAMETKA